MLSLPSFDQITLLRPLWLWGILPVIASVWMLARRVSGSVAWRRVIEAPLLQALSNSQMKPSVHWPVWLAALIGVLAVIALAGPAWDKQTAPVVHNQRATVLVLDLSRSMLSTDVKPNRLTRARFKISDLVDALADREVALVGFARDAFVVSPLTDDGANIKNLLSALKPNIMPRQGSAPGAGIDKARELIEQAGQLAGDIILITDDASGDALASARRARAEGFRISVLAVGSEDGAPIPTGGHGFLKDRSGSIVIPRLEPGSLRRLAKAGGGSFVRLCADQQDIAALTRPMADEVALGAGEKTQIEQWRERGPWLVLALLPLVSALFRRGWLFALVWLLPLPRAQALDWDGLWARPDQRVHQALRRDRSEQVAGLSGEIKRKPELAGSLAYRLGDYPAAAKAFARDPSAQGHYNRGNALAHAGKIDAAIAAYQEALKLDSKMVDARHNLDALQKMRKQAQQKDQQSKNGDRDQNKNKNNKKNTGGEDQPGNKGKDEHPNQHKQPNENKSANKNQSKSEQDKQQQDQAGDRQDQPQADPGKAGQPTGKPKNRGRDPSPADRKSGQDKSAPQPEHGADQQHPDASTAQQDMQGAPPKEPENQQPARADTVPPKPQQRGQRGNKNQPLPVDAEQALDAETRRRIEQRLRRLPDDPGRLLRNKFYRAYQRRHGTPPRQGDGW